MRTREGIDGGKDVEKLSSGIGPYRKGKDLEIS
jgi:hypothetical protein